MPLPQPTAQDDTLSELPELINCQLTEKGLKIEKASADVWVSQFDRAIVEKLGARVEHGYAVQIVQFGEIGGAQFRNQGVFRVHRRRKHCRFVGVMPALLALDNQFFAGNTADVDASAAVHLRRQFHQHDLLPVFRQICRHT